MEFKDSRLALFTEPNAFIQNFNNQNNKEKEIKKIVFQEPYETMPNFYINNNFTKHDCNCVLKNHNNNHNSKTNNCDSNCGYVNKSFNNQNNHDYNCNRGNCDSNNQYQHNDNYHNGNLQKNNGFGFDLKSLLPLLGLFNKGGGADLSGLVGLLGNGNSAQNQNISPTENNANPINLISSIISNKDMMSGMLNLFKGGGLNIFSKKQTTKKELKTTDFEIKNYTRVD